MGTYTELEVAGYPLWSTKSEVDPNVMTIFRESDKRVESRKISDRNPLVWGELREGERDEVETAISYSSKVLYVRDRLDIMGFTLERVRQEFEMIRRDELAKFESCAEEDGDRWFTEDRDQMTALDFDKYAAALRHVLKHGLRPHPFDNEENEGLDPVTRYVLRQNDDFWLGFLATDIRSLVRLACELVDRNAEVVQDITELVAGGYYALEEPVCANAVSSLTRNHPENASRIILTEGSTDREFLQGALRLLYPHLADYYAFLDFAGTRSQGGAGHLASLVKAFAAVGITDRVIAVFDNDTAASEAKRSLNQVTLPDNIAVITYPDLDFLGTYPTLGPGGKADLDVNGLAASLELYLGRDILLRDGSLIPVQWTGYSESIAQYQGEVLQKSGIQSLFREKLARCQNDPGACDQADWSGLRAILDAIFAAFPYRERPNHR